MLYPIELRGHGAQIHFTLRLFWVAVLPPLRIGRCYKTCFANKNSIRASIERIPIKALPKLSL
jgi:hypothetical protein